MYFIAEIIIGVQTEWGLFEFGSYNVFTDTRTSDTVEFTKDGVTWELMPTNVPG